MKEAPPSVTSVDLKNAGLRLVSTLDGHIISNDARTQSLDELIHEFETWQHRRAAHSARDRSCYRTGAALEPYQGHLVDDVALSGLDHLGAVGLMLLVQIAIEHPGLSLSQLITKLFNSRQGAAIRQWGEWSRWHWVGELVHQETVAFLATKTGRDPKARWRNDTVTPRQRYLILELARILDIMVPEFPTRGAAFDWIRTQGGNPRFHTAPVTPRVPDFGDYR